MKNLIKKIKKLYLDWKFDRAYKKKIKELKKRDPFNYKNFQFSWKSEYLLLYYFNIRLQCRSTTLKTQKW